MSYDTFDTDTVQLTLPLHESQQLDQFLEHLIQQLGPQAFSTSLESTSEAIGDANAVAMCLREYVKLELPMTSVLDLIKVLSERLAGDQPVGSGDGAILARLLDQLKTSVPGETGSQV